MVCLSSLLVGAGRHLTVVEGVVVVFLALLGGRTRSSHACLLDAGRCVLVVVLFACVYRVVGWLVSFSAPSVVCGGVGVTWHVGDMEGTPHVVDAGDVRMWLSGLLVSRLSCFVGDVGC